MTAYARSKSHPRPPPSSSSSPSRGRPIGILTSASPSLNRATVSRSATATTRPISPFATYTSSARPRSSRTASYTRASSAVSSAMLTRPPPNGSTRASCEFLVQITLSPTRNGLSLALRPSGLSCGRSRALRAARSRFLATTTWHCQAGSNRVIRPSRSHTRSAAAASSFASTCRRFRGGTASRSTRSATSNDSPLRIRTQAWTIWPAFRRTSDSSPDGTPPAIRSRSGAPCPTGGNWPGSPIPRKWVPVPQASSRSAIKSQSVIDSSSTIRNLTASGLAALCRNPHPEPSCPLRPMASVRWIVVARTSRPAARIAWVIRTAALPVGAHTATAECPYRATTSRSR